ncbi:MAG TPA: amino acid permease [Candidatus Melainabacteria bacterium]|nr:amino acid permease [Candidatus Melainabacteria bacterium]HIN65269.1 amino acid permease [Candidatus Obscuribacterales bacterium]
MSSEQNPQPVHFTRAMGLLDSTAVVVGSMIGSGIFIVSAEASRLLGSPGWVLLAWLLSGILTVVGAVCYSELSAMHPEAGGQYVFLRESFGKLAAFLYGWTLFMVIQAGTIAAVGVAFAKFLGVFVPAVSKQTVFFSVGDYSFTALQLVSILVVVLLTAINCRGITAAKLIQTTFTMTKVAALGLLIVLGALSFGKFNGVQANFSSFTTFFSPVDLKGNALEGMTLIGVISLAMVGPLFSSDAWNNLTFTGEEVKEPTKTLPRSLMLGTALVSLLYLLTNVVYMLLIPLKGTEGGADVISRGIQFAAEDRVGTAAAEIIFGSAGVYIMAAAIMISTFGALNGIILAGPRAYYAMARDGLFFKKCGELNANTHVPTFGLIMQGAWSCLLCLSGQYSKLLEYVMFAALLFYVLTVAGLFVMRKKYPNAERPYKVPLYPFLPALYVVLTSVVMIGQICQSPGYSGAGLLIILSGLPAYLIWNRNAAAKSES